MGCGGSKEAVVEAEVLQSRAAPISVGNVGAATGSTFGTGDIDINDVHNVLSIHESHDTKEVGHQTFLASVLEARSKHSKDASVLRTACLRLKEYNQKLKDFVAIQDAQTVKEASEGGFLGLGVNHSKLIAVLCSRTKKALERTKRAYFQLYDRDIRKVIRDETSGDYGKMMSYAISSRSDYIGEMIDAACDGWGCDEAKLVDLFVMFGQEALYEGKEAWEDRTDKKLIDRLNKELKSGYKHLLQLILLLLKGERDEHDEPLDDEQCRRIAESLHAECVKYDGLFKKSTFDEEGVTRLIGENNLATNRRVAVLYENLYDESLEKALDGKCAKRFHAALAALLLPRADYIARRLHDAMKCWRTDKAMLSRLLGGLDGDIMIGVSAAFERKYGAPLPHYIRKEISGSASKMEQATLAWVRVLEEPSRGAESYTEKDVLSYGDDAAELCTMLDMLLVENELLQNFLSQLDVETLAEACRGSGSDDTVLIRTLTTRNKRFLARVSHAYRHTYDEPLGALIDKETKGWYAYMCKFLVVQEAQADAMLLDLALDKKHNKGQVDRKALTEFLCARHPRRVRAAKKKWEAANDESLVDMLSDELEGDMRQLALTLLKGKRATDESDETDAGLAAAQAKRIYKDPSTFIDVLCSNSPSQNVLIGQKFENKYDMSLKRAIGKEYAGYVKNALIALLQGPHEWYAASLRSSFNGTANADKTICRIIGAHDKADVALIARAYYKKYDTPLKADLAAHCKGNYRRLAIAWVDLPDQLEQPSKTITLPSAKEDEADAEEAQRKEGAYPRAPADEDDELDDDDENIDNIPNPESPLYKTKVRTWRRKLESATAAGRTFKADYYRRLLVIYPPVPRKNPLLEGYLAALDSERQGNKGVVAEWLEAVDPAEVGDDPGECKDKATFAEWIEITAPMVKKAGAYDEMKLAWGFADDPEEPDEPAPSDKYSEPEFTPQVQVAPQQPVVAQPAAVMGQVVQPAPVHAAPVQQGGGQQMTVTVPYGHYGGQQMQVDTSQGRMMVQVPAGLGPGSSFVFKLPGAAPVQQQQYYQQPQYQTTTHVVHQAPTVMYPGMHVPQQHYGW